MLEPAWQLACEPLDPLRVHPRFRCGTDELLAHLRNLRQLCLHCLDELLRLYQPQAGLPVRVGHRALSRVGRLDGLVEDVPLLCTPGRVSHPFGPPAKHGHVEDRDGDERDGNGKEGDGIVERGRDDCVHQAHA